MALAVHAVLLAGAALPAATAAQDGPPVEIRVTSAIYGAAQGSADVTPVVTRLVKPELNEFYAAPMWLEVDPAVGQTKQLVVFYEYRGEPRVLTTAEPGAVSYAILLDQADPSRRRRPRAGPLTSPPAVLDAQYGMGRMFQSVTPRVVALLRSDAAPFVIDDRTMGVRATEAAKVLVVTYAYEGTRHTLVAWRGDRLGQAALVAHATNDLTGRGYSAVAPEWVAAAKPDAAREPGSPGPGVGRSPRREVGIAELLKALAELQAIVPAERGPSVTTAIARARDALTEAQREIGYPYPPTSSPPFQARDTTTATHLTLAMTSLETAARQFSSATTTRRGGPMLARTVSAINDALAALRAER